MNPFVSRITNNQTWVVPVSILSFVLGFMLMMARVTGGEVRSTRLAFSNPLQRDRILSGPLDIQKQYRATLEEVNKLRSENTKLQNAVAAVADQTKTAKLLNESLQEAKIVAGLTPLVGPGLKVTMRDSKASEPGAPGDDPSPSLLQDDSIIHDQDVLRVINELYASGAEGISINNIRLGGTSSVRCVGPTVLIDGVRVASPIVVRAIGDPQTLEGGLTMPGGIVEDLQTVDIAMVEIEQAKSISLPAYIGPTSRRHAKVLQANP